MTVLVSQVNHMIKSGKLRHHGRGMCIDWRHLSRPRGLLRCRWHHVGSTAAARQDFTSARLIQPIANNALTLALADTDFDGCMELVQRLTEDKKALYLANSMNSPAR